MSERTTSRVLTVVRYTLIWVAALSGLVPLLWTLSTSLKRQVEAQAYPPGLLPQQPTLDNWSSLFRTLDFTNAAVNSLIVTVGAALLTLFVSLTCAYALVRLRIYGRRLLVLLIVLSLTIPGIVFVVPLYSIAVRLHLYDTPMLLVIVYTGFLTPFITLLLASFIRAVPIEVEEAAIVDGASRLQVLVLVVLPLIRAGVASAMIFASVYAWNEFLIPVILSSNAARPLTVYVSGFVTQKTVEWGPLTAAVGAVILPVVFVVVLLQRHLVTGATAGSIKG